MNILIFGDIVGSIGIKALKNVLPKLAKQYQVDFVIANGENASNGKGLTEKDCLEILNCGVDVITLGNHYASKSQIADYINDFDNVIRPINVLNFSNGKGSEVFSVNGVDVRVTNVLTQGLMSEQVDSPVKSIENLLEHIEPCIHIIDLHGESTSEKKMIGYYFDGKVSAIVGTHTHVQTNDDQVLPKGTGFISDLGMCGAYNSVIGFNPDSVIDKFVNNSDGRFSINNDDDELVNGLFLNIDEETYECLDIEKIRIINRRN